jgi:hypothetical protein
MAKALTAGDILPLVALLTPRERVRLLRLIASPHGADTVVYRSAPPSGDEFSADEDPLAWDAEGWEVAPPGAPEEFSAASAVSAPKLP